MSDFFLLCFKGKLPILREGRWGGGWGGLTNTKDN